MADATLEGMPRIARAPEEIRIRGSLALAVAVATILWWVTQWLIDQPLQTRRALVIAVVVLILGVIAAVMNVSRRVADGLREVRPPAASMVFETRAAARDRRMRYSAAVFFTVVVVLIFDTLAGWGGVTAGVIVGAALSSGVLDLVEASRWDGQERRRRSELWILVRPRALVTSYGRAIMVEVPEEPPDPGASRRR